MKTALPALLLLATAALPAASAAVVASDSNSYYTGNALPGAGVPYGWCASYANDFVGCTWVHWGALPAGGPYTLTLWTVDASGQAADFTFELRGPGACPQGPVQASQAGAATLALHPDCTGAFVWMAAGATVGAFHASVSA